MKPFVKRTRFDLLFFGKTVDYAGDPRNTAIGLALFEDAMRNQ